MTDMTDKTDNTDKIAAIVAEEWRQFQLVRNEGGRASCQDDWPEFNRQRSAQFRAWSEELRDSYYQDLRDAAAQGRNLLTEKYAWMMAETAPERFAELRPFLPELGAEQRALIEEIVELHLRWAADFAADFPLYAGSGRPLRAAEAPAGVTAVETYLRGELCTYSPATLRLYRDYAADCQRQGINLTRLIRDDTARALGLDGSVGAEAFLRRKYGRD